MKQRLALARALIAGPDLLFMDEPFTGLDQQGSETLQARMMAMRGKVAFVMATHELDRAYEVADQFLILKNGNQVFFGNRNDVGTELHEFYRLKTEPQRH